jgi:hypothetical protein
VSNSWTRTAADPAFGFGSDKAEAVRTGARFCETNPIASTLSNLRLLTHGVRILQNEPNFPSQNIRTMRLEKSPEIVGKSRIVHAFPGVHFELFALSVAFVRRAVDRNGELGRRVVGRAPRKLRLSPGACGDREKRQPFVS